MALFQPSNGFATNCFNIYYLELCLGWSEKSINVCCCCLKTKKEREEEGEKEERFVQ